MLYSETIAVRSQIQIKPLIALWRHNRLISDVWHTNYPWGFSFNSTIFFLTSWRRNILEPNATFKNILRCPSGRFLSGSDSGQKWYIVTLRLISTNK